MRISGGCHCGKFTFEADVEPDGVRICHCTDCQKLSGAPFRASVLAPAETYVLRGGEPAIYVKIADSGTRRAQAFCPVCAAPLYSADAENPKTYALRAGLIDQRAQLTPSAQIWRRSALPWLGRIAAAPAHERGP